MENTKKILETTEERIDNICDKLKYLTNELKNLQIKLILILFLITMLYPFKASAGIEKNGVEIIKQYDCPDVYSDGTEHRLCGIIENKTSEEMTARVTINYYDADGIKLVDRIAVIRIDSKGKGKFKTYPYHQEEPFDHYKVELDVHNW